VLEQSTVSEIEQLIKNKLQNFGLKKITLVIEKDHHDENDLFIDIDFDLVEPDIDPQPFMFLTTQVRDVLMQHDQDYFPLLRYHFNPRQKIMGWQ
jgi:hypothetical protein